MHNSVLLKETIEKLNLKDSSIVVDCTLGYAGHSEEILKVIKNGYLYAFDQDIEAINYSTKRLNKYKNFEIIKSNFSNIKKELEKRGIKKVDAILYDLGVSSPQLDNDYRGFSYHKDALLDMRMDLDNKLTAKRIVNEYSQDDLTSILYKYGEEKYAKSIAKGIVDYRKNKVIDSTLELAEIIKNNVPGSYKRDKHPARKTFQALRIEVNHELDVFEKSLNDALDLLNVGGRICVITFHSLEDKICKEVFESVSKIDENVKKLPIIPIEYEKSFKVIGSYTPKKEELDKNNRSRSSKLRVIERIKEG